MTTILVDPASCSARVSGVVCLGATFEIQLTFEGGVLDTPTEASEAEVVLFDDNGVPLNVPPALDSQWKGVIDLATDECKALFVGKRPSDVVTVTVGVWNATDKRLLASGACSVKNNPFVAYTAGVNALLVASFSARVTALESKVGKVPMFDDVDSWIALYASDTEGVKSLTFEVPA